MKENQTVAFKNIQAFYLKTGVASQDELEECYQRLQEEMRHPDFAAVNLFLVGLG